MPDTVLFQGACVKKQLPAIQQGDAIVGNQPYLRRIEAEALRKDIALEEFQGIEGGDSFPRLEADWSQRGVYSGGYALKSQAAEQACLDPGKTAVDTGMSQRILEQSTPKSRQPVDPENQFNAHNQKNEQKKDGPKNTLICFLQSGHGHGLNTDGTRTGRKILVTITFHRKHFKRYHNTTACHSIRQSNTPSKKFRTTIAKLLVFCERFFMDDGQGQEWTRWTEWTRMDC